MKRIILFFTTALLLLSCSSSEEETLAEEQLQTYTISFGMGNFDASVESRTAPGKTIYGINVYYDREKDGIQDDIYAYGLFDNTNSMTITLIGGYKYRFVCSLVKDADDKLYYGPYQSNNFSGYARPFQLSNSNSTAVQNKFITGTSAYLSGLETGTAVIADANTQNAVSTAPNFPSLERYYGELSGYEPKANDRVIIPVKKTFFGNRLIVNGMKDGSLVVKCTIGSSGTVWERSGITADLDTNGSIYSYHNVKECWQKDNTLTATVTYNYTSKRGSWWDLSGSKQLIFKRNVMTTITLNLNPDMSGASIAATEEALDDDNTITLKGDNGTLEVVTVTPGGEYNN